MEIFTTVPLVFGRPANVWLGIILLLLIVFQITSGAMMARGKLKFLRYHKINAGLIILVVIFHAYWGLGLWFFNFQIK